MVSVKYLKKLSKKLVYHLLNKEKEQCLIKLSKKFKIYPEINLILKCIDLYPTKFILIQKNKKFYMKYNTLSTIYEDQSVGNIEDETEYIEESDLLVLQPLYVLSLPYEIFQMIFDSNNKIKYTMEENIKLYLGPHRTLYNHVHIYLQWAHAYCNGIIIKKLEDGTLSFPKSDIHTMLDYIYMIVDNDGNELFY